MDNYKKLLSITILKTIILCSTTVISSVYAEECNKKDNFIYGGIELGLSEPVWSKFDYIDEFERKTRIRLKNSEMYGGKVGWGFYPNMMIEISGTHQPKYGLSYRLPEVDSKFIPGFVVPETPGGTTIKANVYTFNFIYKLPALEFMTIKPYVIGGAGVAIVNVYPAFSDVELPMPAQAALGKEKIEYFKIRKTKTKAPTYQAGIGFSKEIGDYLEIDVSSKFQVVQDIKINYDTLTDPLTGEFSKARPIKKTIAVSEFAFGVLFKLPI